MEGYRGAGKRLMEWPQGAQRNQREYVRWEGACPPAPRRGGPNLEIIINITYPGRGFMLVAPDCPKGYRGDAENRGIEPQRGSMFVVFRFVC